MSHPVPPTLRPSSDGSASELPFWLAAMVLLAMVIARLSADWGTPLPGCTTRQLTGFPCPFCGTTRCLVAVSHLDFATALALNPLSFLLGLGLAIWTGLSMAARMGKKPVRYPRWFAIRRLPWKWIVPAVLLLNWLYLWRSLPE